MAWKAGARRERQAAREQESPEEGEGKAEQDVPVAVRHCGGGP